MSKTGLGTDLDAINEKLKAAGVRLRVVVRNRKLYLRGTLPPRPGRLKAEQTYLVDFGGNRATISR